MRDFTFRGSKMLGKCFFIICLVSVVSAAVTGNLAALSDAVLEGASKGVELSLSILGVMCLWSGIVESLRRAGMIERVSRLIRPLLKKIFKDSVGQDVAEDEITAAIAANVLGISSAATPFALKAMEKLDEINKTPERASDDMVTLSVLGSSCISVMPTTVIALRHAAGAVAPYSVIVPIWICSTVCCVFSVALSVMTRRGK